MGKSHLEKAFEQHIVLLGIAQPVREHQFCERRWRLDFAWPDIKVAVELEGGIWTNGRHTRGSGYVADMEKYNRLAVLGWTLLRYEAKAVTSGAAALEVSSLVNERMRRK